MSLNEIDFYTTTIVNAVIKSTTLTIPTCSYNPHTKPYWNTTVKEAHKREMESRIKWVKEGKPRGMQHPSYAEYKRKKRHFRQCQESASEEYINKLMKTLTTLQESTFAYFGNSFVVKNHVNQKYIQKYNLQIGLVTHQKALLRYLLNTFPQYIKLNKIIPLIMISTTVSSMNTIILNPKRLKILFSVRMTALRKKKFLTLFHY